MHSHMPTAEKPTISKSARVMNPAVSTAIPTARSTTQAIVARRNPRGRPGRRRLVATTPSSERPRPAATTSWSSLLIEMGITPTIDRCRPVEISAPRKARAARGPVAEGRAVTTSTPYAARRMPETIAVELKTRAEKSPSMPRREKWRCHHSGSLVVRTATTTPTERVEMAVRLKRWTASTDDGSVVGA